jgi:hypothetical protein
MARRQTRQCEYQAKQKEAQEYLRDKKGPSKFCGNLLPLQALKESVQSTSVGILRITQGPTTATCELIKRIRRATPSVEIQNAEVEVALLTLTLPEERADEGAALLLNAQQQWRWRTALQNPRRFMDIIRNLCIQRGQGNPTELTLRHIAQDTANIVWDGQPGHKHVMTIGNTGSQHREEHSWWAQGPTYLEQLQEWKQWVQYCQAEGNSQAPTRVTIANGVLRAVPNQIPSLESGVRAAADMAPPPRSRHRASPPSTAACTRGRQRPRPSTIRRRGLCRQQSGSVVAQTHVSVNCTTSF